MKRKHAPSDASRNLPRQAQDTKVTRLGSWRPVARAVLVVGGAVALGLAIHRWGTQPHAPVSDQYVPRPKGSLAFNKDIAPIIFERCSSCHHPGQAAPFSLLTFQDVARRAKAIAQVTATRYMPPWLPEPGFGDFANVRRLSTQDLGLIQQWIAEGVLEGHPADLPPPPQWPEEWELGQPDLIVKLEKPYILIGEGRDVYRNFVVPIPNPEPRYVRAIEFKPGNPKAIHHAFMNMDQTRESRRLARNSDPPGFDGMDLPESAFMVGGQILSWQPGKRADAGNEGLAWTLEKDTDLVLQLHMNPTGKPESVQPAVGFYFTDQAPTNTPFRIYLPVWQIDIPAGATNHAVEDAYVLPVDVDVLRVSPHAHYLAREMQGYAVLPDGKKQWLLLIKKWDFNWQSDYRYAKPVYLPKGTTVVMRFTYDNSTNNVRNPNHPPKRVRYGLQTTDEMAELCFQVLPRNAADLAVLQTDYLQKMARVGVAYNEGRLRENPNDAQAHAKLGQALLQFARFAEALEHLQQAIRLNPTNDKPHYDVGALYLALNRLEEARKAFETVVRLNPDDYQARGSLGVVHFRQRDFDKAEAELIAALRLNPDDPIAQRNLELVRTAKQSLLRR